MDGTLGDLFRVVAASASSQLLPESRIAHLLRVADLLPPSSVAGFERSLGRDPITVDFAVHFRAADPCGSALAARAQSGQLDAIGWPDVAGLFRETSRHGSAQPVVSTTSGWSSTPASETRDHRSSSRRQTRTRWRTWSPRSPLRPVTDSPRRACFRASNDCCGPAGPGFPDRAAARPTRRCGPHVHP